MTKEELEKATGQELIDERNYCGVDGYYGVYLDNVNAEMLKRFNRLAELEDKLANADYQLEGRDIKIKELETRCNELFLQTCEQAEKIKELKADNDARKFAMAMSEKVEKQLREENADLKEEVNKTAFARGNLEEENTELRKELKEWKDEWQEQVQKANDESYARTLQTIQLTKAKELIEDMYNKIPASHSDYYKDVMERARQFLNSEVKK